MAEDWTAEFRSLLEAPSPAVLTTTKKDGRPLATPVWFRWHDGALEVVIAKGDVKLRHLARNPECSLVVFETVPPFRGLEVRGTPDLLDLDVTEVRTAISGRYLGAERGERYAALRQAKPGILLRFRADAPRVWDLRSMLPR